MITLTSLRDPAAGPAAAPAPRPHDDAITWPPAVRATVLYATDPICSHCWAMEPAWRRLLYHYGHLLEVRHVYGGLLPHWEGFADVGAGIRAPADVATHWAEVAQRYGQPIDPSVWLRDPLLSSFPPSIALHVVRLIAPAREDDYLRRLRQALFLEARNIARPEVLTACAADFGLERRMFADALDGGSAAAAFFAELQAMRELPVHGFPTLILSASPATSDDAVTRSVAPAPWVLRGTQPYDRLVHALSATLGALPPQRAIGVDAVLTAYGSGTTREFAEVLELAPAAAAGALAAVGARRTPLAGDALWHHDGAAASDVTTLGGRFADAKAR